MQYFSLASIHYVLIDVLAIAVSFIIYNNTIRNSVLHDGREKKLRLFIVTIFVYLLTDLVWGVCIGFPLGGSETVLVISTYIVLAMTSITTYTWGKFALWYAVGGKSNNFWLELSLFVVLGVQIVLLGFNVVNNKVFYFAGGNYVTGYGRLMIYILQGLFYLVLTVHCIFLCRKYKENKELSKRYSMISRLTVIPLAAAVLQTIFTNTPFYAVGYMLDLVLIFINIISIERREFVRDKYAGISRQQSIIIDNLSKGCTCVYMINLDTDEYEIIEPNEEYNNNVLKHLNRGDNFFDDIEIDVKRVLYEDDIAGMLEFFDKENLIRRLEEEGSISYYYRVLIENEPLFYMISLSMVDKDAYDGENMVVGIVHNVDKTMKEGLADKEQVRKMTKKAKKAEQAKLMFVENMGNDLSEYVEELIINNTIIMNNPGDTATIFEASSSNDDILKHMSEQVIELVDMGLLASNQFIVSPAPSNIKRDIMPVINRMTGFAKYRNVDFAYDIDSIGDENIIADMKCVNKIIENLITNAIKYTKEGGIAALIVEKLRYIKNDCVSYCFTISDSGIGMDKSYLDKIFDEFSRVSSSKESGIKGTGLGMTITKKLVDLLDGRMEIESQIGVGTCIRVYLTFERCTDVQYETSRVNSVDEDEIAMKLSGRKILIVDDSKTNREIAASILRQEGLEVFEAESGKAAIDILKEANEDDYDLVLMDIVMKEMDGYETTGKIRQLPNFKDKHIPIVAMTANTYDYDRQKSLEAGMDEHLTKPIKLTELFETLERLILQQ